MVDYVAVLKRAISTLPRDTPELRARIYAKARQTVESKLDLVKPAPSEAMRAKQLAALDDAVVTLEAEYLTSAEPVEDVAVVESPVEETPQHAELPEQPAPQPDVEPISEPEFIEASSPAEQDLEPERNVAEMSPAPRVEADDANASLASLETKSSDIDYQDEVLTEPINTPEPVVSDSIVPDTGPNSDSEFTDFDDQDDLREQHDRDAFFDDVFGEKSVPEAQDQATQTDLQNDGLTEKPASSRTLDDVVIPPVARKKSGSGKAILLGLIGLGVVGGGGYLAYQERDTIMAAVQGSDSTDPETIEPTENTATEPSDAAAVDDSIKFTQRLTENGVEVDAGIGTANGVQSVAQLEPGTQSPAASGTDTPATPSTTPAPQTAIAVGEQAIFYEERTSAEQGTAKTGAVVWRLVQESPGNDLPAEPAVRGEISIPENNIIVRMTLRRNADDTLPASHIWELVVDAPPEFGGGGIEEIQRINMKPSEAAPGQPLVAVPVKIADGFFLIALDAEPNVEQINLSLLNQMDWIDIPVVYRTGRRALFTMEKGLTGQKVFNDALTAWGQRQN